MLNGVDVNDNLFGSPQNLFIEDAIEETQVLTSGITAEYGRFTGGVVNAITKSGGNTFSGSYRTNLTNPRWTKQTPFELCDPAVTTASRQKAAPRPDTCRPPTKAPSAVPILRDRLWFFGAGRLCRDLDRRLRCRYRHRQHSDRHQQARRDQAHRHARCRITRFRAAT